MGGGDRLLLQLPEAGGQGYVVTMWVHNTAHARVKPVKILIPLLPYRLQRGWVVDSRALVQDLNQQRFDLADLPWSCR